MIQLHEHSGAVIALLFLPVVVMTLMTGVRILAESRVGVAVRIERAFEAAPPRLRLAALLMTVSAAVHAGLVPLHWAAEPATALLFVLDAGALVLLAAALALGLRHTVPAAAAVLVAGLIAYSFYIAAGLETADPVGVITKVVELIAIGLLIPIPVRQTSRRTLTS